MSKMETNQECMGFPTHHANCTFRYVINFYFWFVTYIIHTTATLTEIIKKE